MPNETGVGGKLEVTLLHEPSNLGYGGAANRGVMQLPDHLEWVVICNPDIRVEPDTFLKLLANLEALPDTAVVGPAIITPRDEVYPSARAIPGIRIGIGHALLGDLWPSNPWSLSYLGDYTSDKAHSVGWLSGAFIMIKRSAFDRIGGFDERYFMFFEDVDLGFRIKKAGLRNVYIPSARVHHSGAHATSSREKRHARRPPSQCRDIFIEALLAVVPCPTEGTSSTGPSNQGLGSHQRAELRLYFFRQRILCLLRHQCGKSFSAAGSPRARIRSARIPAFLACPIPTVATGIPEGI